MKVKAQDILAAWLDLDQGAPYHTEQKPIGTDRKVHEGPLLTSESFPNTWLPTEKQKPEDVEVTQIEVVQVAVEASRKAREEVLPGVPRSMFRAWEQAHDAEENFWLDPTSDGVQKFVHYLLQLAREVEREGLKINADEINRLKNYPKEVPPDRGNEYSQVMVSRVINQLDGVLQILHQYATQVTGTNKDEWYMYQAEQMRKQKVRAPSVLSPEELREQRGPMAPFLEEMWERRRRHGNRIAIDVKQPCPRCKTPIGQYDDCPNCGLMSEDRIMSPDKQWEPDEATDYERQREDYQGDQKILSKTIGEAGDWEEQEEGVGVQGSVFSYEKSIVTGPTGNGEDIILNIYAFVEPFSTRKSRFLEQAKRMRGFGGRSDRISQQRAMELEREAEMLPEKGYINDIEVFFKDELIYHRERSFVPQAALTQREFMAGDSMQRAITDIQQFVRTKIDPVPVGQFIQSALKNPGKGEGKLSMKITAADIMPFDPSKRRLKTQPPVRKGPMRAQPEPEMTSYLEDFGPSANDYEGLLMLYDNVASGIDEIANAFINIQPSLTPEQQRESGLIISKLLGALRALGARNTPVR